MYLEKEIPVKLFLKLINNESINFNIFNESNQFNYSKTLINYDNLISFNENSKTNLNFNLFDVVVVLTVWKRNNLEKQLNQVKRQSIVKFKKINLIVFQNSEHIDIKDIINKWEKNKMLPDNII